MKNLPLQILIVEDEYITQKIISKYVIEMGYEVAGLAMSYDESVEILKNKKVDVAILDITIKGHKNGIVLADYINKNYTIPHLFLTAYSDTETIKSAISTLPSAYVIKPFEKGDLFSALELALLKFNENKIDQFVFVKYQDVFKKICIKEILFIEAQGNYLLFYTLDEVYKHRSTLIEFKKMLPVNFLQTHKGFIVNKKYIDFFSTNSILIKNHTIPISRTFKDEFLSNLM